jgi:hypothetical protein
MSSEDSNKLNPDLQPQPNPDLQPQPQPEKDIELNIFKDAINPGVCFFTILFKAIAISTFNFRLKLAFSLWAGYVMHRLYSLL